MKEQRNRQLTVLTGLVAILVVAVVAQSVVIFGLHKKLRPSRTALRFDAGHKDSGKANRHKIAPLDPFDHDFDDWDPFKEMHSMHDRINQMFGSAFNRFQRSDDFGGLFGDYSFSPAVNIEDKGDRYLVTVDLPGTENSRIEVNVEGQTLTISGSARSESRDEDSGTMLRQERRSGRFHRAVTLPSPVDADRLTTEQREGVLHIEIPKR